MVLAGLPACRQPNPEWLGPASDPTTSGSSEGGGTLDTGGDSTVGTTTIGPIPMQCASEPVLGEGECPASCTSCDGGRCLVDCSTADCEDADVACPEGWPCDFACTADSACKQADLTCATDRDCTVICQGKNACRETKVTCGAGPCAVTCGSQKDVCRTLDVECGPADATITCETAQDVAVLPTDGSRCACEAIGCEG